jgi:hypothetical protein
MCELKANNITAHTATPNKRRIFGIEFGIEKEKHLRAVVVRGTATTSFEFTGLFLFIRDF